jgi:hypothetical protein
MMILQEDGWLYHPWNKPVKMQIHLTRNNYATQKNTRLQSWLNRANRSMCAPSSAARDDAALRRKKKGPACAEPF